MTQIIDNLQKHYTEERGKAKERKEQLEVEQENVGTIIERMNGAIAALNEAKQEHAQQQATAATPAAPITES